MASSKISSVVRGAGLLTSIFSGLVSAMRKIAGPGKEGFVEEKLHCLSTPEGQKTLETMARMALYGERFFDAIKPGVVIVFYQEGSLISLNIPPLPGEPSWDWKRFKFVPDDDKRICEFLHSNNDFFYFVSFLAYMLGLNYREATVSSDAVACEFWKYEKTS